ncbi:hypothetical protein SNEBB_008968 [Seison nebaliae]|nr:hypothetical protein SNEBB_008968 [Seison nebaliae]
MMVWTRSGRLDYTFIIFMSFLSFAHCLKEERITIQLNETAPIGKIIWWYNNSRNLEGIVKSIRRETFMSNRIDRIQQLSQLMYFDSTTLRLRGNISLISICNEKNPSQSLCSNQCHSSCNIEFSVNLIERHRKSLNNNKLKIVKSLLFSIFIQDVNNHAAFFHTDFKEISINENVPLGIRLPLEGATDYDFDSDKRILEYRLMYYKSPNEKVKELELLHLEKYDIHIDHLNLVLVSKLDREKQSELQLILLARYQRPFSHLIDETRMRICIRIIDVNDAAPQFDQNVFHISLSEFTQVGQIIKNFTATDADSGMNGKVEYALRMSSSKLSSSSSLSSSSLSSLSSRMSSQSFPQDLFPFSINRHNGSLMITKPLDFEHKDSYQFLVEAHDSVGKVPTERRNTGHARVMIQVIDENDNQPQMQLIQLKFPIFNDDTFKKYLPTLKLKRMDVRESENMENEFILFIKGIDADYSDSLNCHLNEWSFRDRNELKRHLNKLVNSLKFNQNLLSTSSSSSSSSLSIQSSSQNKFYKSMSPYIREMFSTPQLFEMEEIHTSDADKLHMSPSSSGFNNEYRPRQSTIMCRIKVLSQLNREKSEYHLLKIKIMDREHHSEQLLLLHVLDVNDNSPIFINATYNSPSDSSLMNFRRASDCLIKKSISENLKKGEVVTTIQATDMDQGLNGKIYYSITKQKDEMFWVDKFSGNVYLTNGRFDREKVNEHSILIEATDNGKNVKKRRTSQCILQINVLDDNDNSPKFEFPSYHFYLAENMTIGSIIGYVKATDKDEGLNSRINLKLQPIEQNGNINLMENKNDLYATNNLQLPFAIDGNGRGKVTGILKLVQQLDRELKKEYKFKIIATDFGRDIHRETAVLATITVTDINDNAPHFIWPPEILEKSNMEYLSFQSLTNTLYVNKNYFIERSKLESSMKKKDDVHLIKLVRFRASDRDNEGANSQIIFTLNTFQMVDKRIFHIFHMEHNGCLFMNISKTKIGRYEIQARASDNARNSLFSLSRYLSIVVYDDVVSENEAMNIIHLPKQSFHNSIHRQQLYHDNKKQFLFQNFSADSKNFRQFKHFSSNGNRMKNRRNGKDSTFVMILAFSITFAIATVVFICILTFQYQIKKVRHQNRRKRVSSFRQFNNSVKKSLKETGVHQDSKCQVEKNCVTSSNEKNTSFDKNTTSTVATTTYMDCSSASNDYIPSQTFTLSNCSTSETPSPSQKVGENNDFHEHNTDLMIQLNQMNPSNDMLFIESQQQQEQQKHLQLHDQKQQQYFSKQFSPETSYFDHRQLTLQRHSNRQPSHEQQQQFIFDGQHNNELQQKHYHQQQPQQQEQYITQTLKSARSLGQNKGSIRFSHLGEALVDKNFGPDNSEIFVNNFSQRDPSIPNQPKSSLNLLTHHSIDGENMGQNSIQYLDSIRKQCSNNNRVDYGNGHDWKSTVINRLVIHENGHSSNQPTTCRTDKENYLMHSNDISSNNHQSLSDYRPINDKQQKQPISYNNDAFNDNTSIIDVYYQKSNSEDNKLELPMNPTSFDSQQTINNQFNSSHLLYDNVIISNDGSSIINDNNPLTTFPSSTLPSGSSVNVLQEHLPLVQTLTRTLTDYEYNYGRTDLIPIVPVSSIEYISDGNESITTTIALATTTTSSSLTTSSMVSTIEIKQPLLQESETFSSSLNIHQIQRD